MRLTQHSEAGSLVQAHCRFACASALHMTTLRELADALAHPPSSSGSAFISNGPWYGVFGSLIFAGFSSALILSFSSRLAAQHSKQGQETQAAATSTLQQSRPAAHPHPTLLSESERAHPSPPRGRWLPRHLCSCLTPFASSWSAAAALLLERLLCLPPAVYVLLVQA